ncbi:hypothetical protein Daura_23200 [Dactylosporangium aurantiacum]|uniref:Uncharacterized protein n=1 Tax=Dactylosporangium aurantiacum TaxID=35754 RepID=A0A9Q9IPG3_9ACTN|nr:hypothetical protein [Dactylosporangium aurantiacum]MDG6104006.1 hypothetical protein [Dactylosporangium aurantiacum]UWZ58818.1 hypothetical protein Daura_23200 [Dactylosporangium aurantiacum]
MPNRRCVAASGSTTALADVVRHSGIDGRGRRFITFEEDGTSTALNLPPGVFHLNGPGSPIDTSGSYALGLLPPATAGPRASIDLNIGESTGTTAAAST